MGREINLSNRDEVVQVDEEDYIYLILHGPYYLNNGYARSRQHGYLHILVAKRLGFKEDEVDHEDNNPLNCCRINLRPATSQQNKANRVKQEGTSSRYKGVTWTSKGWKAQIMVNYKNHHLGYFTSEEDAADAYNIAAGVAFGKYVKLNQL